MIGWGPDESQPKPKARGSAVGSISEMLEKVDKGADVGPQKQPTSRT